MKLLATKGRLGIPYQALAKSGSKETLVDFGGCQHVDHILFPRRSLL